MVKWLNKRHFNIKRYKYLKLQSHLFDEIWQAFMWESPLSNVGGGWATRCWTFLAAKFHRNVANVTAPLGTVWVFWLGQSKQLLRTPLNTAKVLLHVLFSVTFALANTYIFFYKSSLYCDQALIMQKWKAHKQQTTHNRCLILLN